MKLIRAKCTLKFFFFIINRTDSTILQRYQLPTISWSNDVIVRPRRRLTNTVAANDEGVCGGMYGGLLCGAFKSHLRTNLDSPK